MGKPFGIEVGRNKAPVTGTFTATGQSASFTPLTPTPAVENGTFNIALTGTAVASVQLEKSFDGGTTWCQLWAGGTQLKQWSYNSVNIAESWEETEAGVVYRLNCTAYTSGTLAYRLSQ